MTPLPVPDTARAVLTSAQEGALADAIRAGRRAHLLAQRHLAARLRRELPPIVSARAAAAAVLAALRPRLPLDQDALRAAISPLLPHALTADARARVLADLATWPLDQDALRAGDAARAAFVAANHGLVVTVARRYQHRGLPLDDLVQEGTSVSCAPSICSTPPAAPSSPPTPSGGLSRRSAAPWPRRSPSPTSPATCSRSAPASLARPTPCTPPWAIAPSRADLAAALGLPRARVDALTAPLPAPVPLDLTMGDAETMTLGDLLPDPAALRPHDEAEAQELAAAVRAALAGLPPRERAILAARHGLDGEAPRTLQEIGHRLGLTRQAVQQAEARALARLRLPALRRWLADAPAS